MNININKEHRSVNFDNRPEGSILDKLIIHYTEVSFSDALTLLTKPSERPVSSHYLIHKNGTIFELLDPKFRAWHAGESYWDGQISINNSSIGIELDNNGQEAFPDRQIESLIILAKNLISHYNLKQEYILGHSDIACHRKSDPGQLFPWQELAKNNIGLYFEPEIDCEKESEDSFYDLLKSYGYNMQYPNEAIKAFNEHYCKFHNSNEWDKKSISIAKKLVNYRKNQILT